MFWAKIVCEGCNRKNRESRAVYSRGSYFCSSECRDRWAHANPPPAARGSFEALRQEAAIVIDAALDELRKARGLAPRTLATGSQALAQVAGMVGHINRTHSVEEQNAALMRFHTDVLRCAPLLRGLGHLEEAALIESTDIMKVAGSSSRDAAERMRLITDTLERVRPS